MGSDEFGPAYPDGPDGPDGPDNRPLLARIIDWTMLALFVGALIYTVW